MTDIELLERMVEDLRRVRNKCEPKVNTKPALSEVVERRLEHQLGDR